MVEEGKNGDAHEAGHQRKEWVPQARKYLSACDQVCLPWPGVCVLDGLRDMIFVGWGNSNRAIKSNVVVGECVCAV
jgi:hypothetical protein